MKAGRMDIVCHVLINSFFLSHRIRDDVTLHLVFSGPPDPIKHIEIYPKKVVEETGRQAGKEGIDISKKDIIGLIKKMLYKYKPGQRTEVWPGYYIEKKTLLKIVEELRNQGVRIYVLDKKGKDIKNVEFGSDSAFVVGDHEGLPKPELRRLKKESELISLGNKTYFASQAVTILHHELDSKEF
jgi:tRNA (pseudouridine54-N1)-methyltransferase